ncbi:hypothetical protein OG936_09060 [Streptomyces sp. NBC_00846]|uniref:DUF6932 family protein n=1 Tax=Streptomyces sp. NBC_00846 TaxID=2975849 RepID=UPI0038642D83|nr:hypothetical protein OG936_09060 [Streptomyces sp. NBC_00846]
MTPSPAFDPVTECPPPGRFPLTWDEVESELVKANGFAESSTRGGLLEELRVHFALVELATGTVGRLWLARSFVSGKVDPEDVDVTYLIPPDAYARAMADPDTVDQIDNLGTKDWCVRQGLRVDAYVLRLPETEDFRALGVTGAMAVDDHKVFEHLGVYDEIWQRCRSGRNGILRGALLVRHGPGGGTGRRGRAAVLSAYANRRIIAAVLVSTVRSPHGREHHSYVVLDLSLNES